LEIEEGHQAIVKAENDALNGMGVWFDFIEFDLESILMFGMLSDRTEEHSMEGTTRVIEGLKKAMQAEADGHNFYIWPPKNTKDKKGKEVFISLAKDESIHWTI
jgi:hypothetical protein